MKHLLFSVFSLALAVSPLAVASPARADKQAQAIALFETGSTLYDEGKYEEALKAFQKAYKLEPAAALFINIAQCHRQLGNHEAAIGALERYLTDEPEGDNRAEVEELLAAERAILNPPPPAPPPPPEPAPVEPAPAAAPPEPAPVAEPVQEESGGSLFSSPIFWAAIGGAALVAVGGGVAAVAIVTAPPPAEPTGTLGTYDLR